MANGGSASSPSAVHLRPLLMAPGSNGKATSGRLPTSDELMKELCKINPSTNTSLANDVEERYYSHEESLRAMRNIITWAESYDREFFENVYEFGCVPKVASYLEAGISDGVSERIWAASRCVGRLVYAGPKGQNAEICEEIATVFVKRDGVRLLVAASDEMLRGGAVASNAAAAEAANTGTETTLYTKPMLIALENTWRALRNLTFYRLEYETLKKKDQLLAAIDAGFGALSKLSRPSTAAASSVASKIIEQIFRTKRNSVLQDCITASDFDGKKAKKRKRKHLIEKSVELARRRPDGSNTSVSIASLRFLTLCFKKSIFRGTKAE